TEKPLRRIRTRKPQAALGNPQAIAVARRVDHEHIEPKIEKPALAGGISTPAPGVVQLQGPGTSDRGGQHLSYPSVMSLAVPGAGILHRQERGAALGPHAPLMRSGPTRRRRPERLAVEVVVDDKLRCGGPRRGERYEAARQNQH